jgi:quaternary ammonium compound-resistance protein SugE
MGFPIKVLPLRTAYAVWAGIGGAGTVSVGVLRFDEPTSPGPLVCLAAIVAGMAGLQSQEGDNRKKSAIASI